MHSHSLQQLVDKSVASCLLMRDQAIFEHFFMISVILVVKNGGF